MFWNSIHSSYFFRILNVHAFYENNINAHI